MNIVPITISTTNNDNGGTVNIDITKKPIFENYVDRLFDTINREDIKEDHIIDNIYLSDCRSSINYDKYTLIVNCDYPYNNTPLNKKRLDIVDAISSELRSDKTETNKPVTFYLLGVGIDDHDKQDLSGSFDEVVELMKNFNSKAKVLVHCRMGISRSSSFVLAYLMKYHGMRLEYALEYLKKKRPIVQPNPGFLHQLKRYDDKIFTLY